MLQISKKTDYGLVFLAYLARYYNSRLVSLTEVANANRLPLPFLRQLAQKLTKAHIITSKEGTGGGYKLARHPKDITLSEVVKVFEGSVAPVACLDEKDLCPAEEICSTKKIWQAVYGDMIKKFHTTTLEALI